MTAEAAPLPPTSPTRGVLSFAAVLVCFVLSGFAALLYQTVWSRQFSVVFGTSELAVATVLASYMAGLALGAAVAGRLAGRIRRPVLAYGLLELGVAAGALAVPFELDLARRLQAALIGGGATLPDAGGSGQALFYLVASFLVILVPTTFMGATLPLLTRYVVRRREQIGTRVGALYATNTAGAVAGALVAAFALLPALGLRGTVLVGVALNGLVFLVAAALAKLDPLPGSLAAAGPAEAAEPDEPPGDARARWILPMILVSGIASFTYEVVWTRLLSHVVGGSVQAFATMLASFLTGITLGSAVASVFARSRRASAVGFALSQAGIALASIWVYARMDGLAGGEPSGIERFAMGLVGSILESVLRATPSEPALRGFVVLLPATVFIGATFPFALRTLARSRAAASPGSARVYAWNTVGAIAGALLAGFLVVPGLGFAGAIRATILVNAVLAAATAVLVLGRPSRVLAAVLAAGALALGVLYRPAAPDRLLRFSALAPGDDASPEDAVLFQEVGRSATVTVVAQVGRLAGPGGEPPRFAGYEVRSNGLPEAGVRPAGSPPTGQDQERYLTALPVVARPDARSMMVIGFGGGIALERVPRTVERVDVVELEPAILAANRAISPRRAVDPFRDKRLHVVTNDARGALALTDARWDVVVSQPSHPWTAGASHLYTREFLQQVREHLTSEGVMVQWMQAGFLDEGLLRSFVATLLDAFPHVRLYRPAGGMLVFLASAAPLDVEVQAARTGRPFRDDPDGWRDLGLACVEDLLAVLAADRRGLEELAAGAPVSTDDRNLLAMRARPTGPENLSLDRLDRLLYRFDQPEARPLDPLLDPGSDLVAALGDGVDRAWVARRLIYVLPTRAILSTNVLTDTPQRKYAQGFAKASWAAGEFGAGAADLQVAYGARSDDERVAYALLRELLPGIARGDASLRDAARLTVSWTGGARTVLDALRHAARGEWQALEAQDAELGAISPPDTWYLDAQRLRATWRLRVALPRPSEALALCDRALVVEPDPRVLLVRLEAAEAAGIGRAVLETLGLLCDFGGERAASLPAGLGDEVVGALRSWQGRLADLDLRWPEAEARRERLAEHLARILPASGAPR